MSGVPPDVLEKWDFPRGINLHYSMAICLITLGITNCNRPDDSCWLFRLGFIGFLLY